VGRVRETAIDPRAVALRLVAVRPRAVAEIRELLASRGVPVEVVERTVTALSAEGHLNDEKLARELIAARTSRLGHGRVRLLLDLERRGVSREVARAAWDRLVADGDLDPGQLVARAVARRVRSDGPLRGPAVGRLHAALLRAGFEEDEILAAIEPRRAHEDPDAGADGRWSDLEFP
jgi:regulatory protein